ncbi:response regulator [Nonomuraea sp. KC401]|uniref:Transcriptional regulatory protein n=1 Tax=Nonomuraea mesophila TaxID=2530382 RepID=A0A4R5EIY6_9ACTN|nr:MULTISPECIES: response regulator [Nonomuraea]NBE98402.1 response regulator [Nonomuraea sp. K271]TDE34469.1 response regulator [Nonomuraea mesophila]TLF61096.1 response regulator [Nonomuraea sp. KC401]
MPEARDITVLIVDDDPVVTAALHAQVNRVLGFRVVGIAHSGHAALAAAARFAPRLVLLDLHLPDLPGLEVAHRLRRPDQPPADVIVISGRKESATVRAAIQRGALYYLVKPTRAGTLEQTLLRYAATVAQLESGGRFAEQQEIDRIFRSLHLDQGARPKSISAATEQAVLDALAGVDEDASAHELGELIGVSRATARRYLEHLAERGLVEGRPRYGPTGRPQHRYRVR